MVSHLTKLCDFLPTYPAQLHDYTPFSYGNTVSLHQSIEWRSSMDQDTSHDVSTVPTKAERFVINREFGLFWLGHTISKIGSRTAGLSFVAILVLRATPIQLGWLEAIGALPALLISLFAGIWIDRVRRYPLLIWADIGRAILLFSIPLAAILSVLYIQQLYIVAALVGTLTVLFEAASQAFLPALVPHTRLVESNSKLEAASELAEIIGPSLGGFLVQVLNAPVMVFLDALTFLASALCIRAIRTKEHLSVAPEMRVGLWSDMWVGLRLLFSNPLLRATTAYSVIRTFCGGAFATLYSLYILRTLDLTPLVCGLLITMGGIGGILGAFATSKIIARFGVGVTLIGCGILDGVMALLTPLARGPIVIIIGLLMLGQLVGDFGMAIFGINEVSLRQRIVPNSQLGRANAGVQFLVGGVGALGAIVAGLSSEIVGIRLILLIGASGIMIASAWLLFSPLRKLR
jgi:MFS family permease